LHAKLSLLQSSIRISSLKDDYPRQGPEDARFRDFNGAIQSMVTSTAQNDSGLFETNLHDERYLPFEGAGAISRWNIEIPNAIPQFDFETISDVILHIRYTCREAGHLKTAATDAVKDVLQDGNTGLLQLYNVGNEFASAWQLFKSAPADPERKLVLSVDKHNFPYWTLPLGIDDHITATFCSIDLKKNKLIVATQNLPFAGDGSTGWSLTVDNSAANNISFNFLKSAFNQNRNVYMVISYSA